MLKKLLTILLFASFAVASTAESRASDSTGSTGGAYASVPVVAVSFHPLAKVRDKLKSWRDSRKGSEWSSVGQGSSGGTLSGGSSGGYGSGRYVLIDNQYVWLVDNNASRKSARCNCCSACTGKPGCTCGCANCTCGDSNPVGERKDAAPAKGKDE